MSDRNSAESAFLTARARFLSWVDEVNQQWNQGNVSTGLAILDNKLNQLPSDMQAKSRALNPQAWAAVDQRNKSRKLPGD